MPLGRINNHYQVVLLCNSELISCLSEQVIIKSSTCKFYLQCGFERFRFLNSDMDNACGTIVEYRHIIVIQWACFTSNHVVKESVIVLLWHCYKTYRSEIWYVEISFLFGKALNCKLTEDSQEGHSCEIIS